jgi:hypothetical protein
MYRFVTFVFWCDASPIEASKYNAVTLNVHVTPFFLQIYDAQYRHLFPLQLPQIAEQGLDNTRVHDCVLACPAYWTDAQRRAYLDAAEVCQRIVFLCSLICSVLFCLFYVLFCVSELCPYTRTLIRSNILCTQRLNRSPA